MKGKLIATSILAASLLWMSGAEAAERGRRQENTGGHTAGVQTLYFGGDIITMEGDKPEYVEAVIERDGRIIYAGKKSEAVNNFAGKTLEVDLQGKTINEDYFYFVNA